MEPAMHRAMGPSQPGFWLDIDLTMSQLKLLFVLRYFRPEGDPHPRRMGELARALGVTLPTVSAVVDRLVERELVRREEDPHDRRSVFCQLTEAGLALTDRLAEGSRLHTAALLAYLAEDELATVAQAMELLIGASVHLRQGVSPGVPAGPQPESADKANLCN
jgi:DNA-binding MarR family transcriptional regulator